MLVVVVLESWSTRDSLGGNLVFYDSADAGGPEATAAEPVSGVATLLRLVLSSTQWLKMKTERPEPFVILRLDAETSHAA